MKALDPWTLPLSGTSLIEASAGTGKTYTLTTLYVRLLVEERRSPREILVVTYTKAATAELRERVRSRILETLAAGAKEAAGSPLDSKDPEADRQLRDLAARAAGDPAGDPLLRALSDFDEAAIFTIHGFCQRTLQDNAFESGMPFDAELVEKSKPIEETLAHDLFRRILADEDPAFVRWLVDGPGSTWAFAPEPLHDKILRKLGADDDMPLVPPPGPDAAADPGALFASAASDRRRWAAAWREVRDEVVALFAAPNGMKGGSYKIEYVKGARAPSFDVFARAISDRGDDDGAVASVPLPKHFEQYSIEGIAKGARKGKEPVAHAVFADFGAVHDSTQALDAACEARVLALRRRFVELARTEAARRRNAQHLYFFDDLLSEVRRALRGTGGPRLTALLRERHPVALIDEFQDTDPVQYDVFRHVWHDPAREAAGGLVLIGDPKQAIYSFRGADVFTYLEAHGDAEGALYGLDRNYRSDPGLIGAVNGLFARPARPFRVDAIEFVPVGPRPDFVETFEPGAGSEGGLRVLFLEREAIAAETGRAFGETEAVEVRFGRTHVVRGIANDIARRLESGARIGDDALAPSDIAVLCRKKSEIRLVREALEAMDIPCVDRGEADVFESREAWELSSVLQAMIRPTDPARLRGALSTGAHGADATRIASLSDDSAELAALSEDYAEYGRIWAQSGFGRAFETWRRRQGVTERLLAYRDGERRITNWLHLAELLQRHASERQPSRGGLVAALDRAIASEEARSVFGGDATLLRLERDDRAVRLVTLHASKGLEYPVVYLPFLWEDPEPGSWTRIGRPPVRFHDAETRRRTLDLAGSEESRSAERDETFSEELRLLYVGLTRARHECVIAWGAIKSAPKSPLAYLIEGAEEAAGEGSPRSEPVKEWRDDDWIGAFETLAGEPDASVSVETMDLSKRSAWKGERQSVAALCEPPTPRSLPAPTRTTSFTALTREGHVAALPSTGAEVLGRDLDARVDRPEEEQIEENDPDLASGLHAFPRGAEAGTFLHSILEEVDFPAVASEGAEGLRGDVLRQLDASGMDADLVETALYVVEAVATTPLRTEPMPFRFADLAGGALHAEMEFTLSTPGEGFTPDSLATVLEDAPDGSPLRRYAPHVARLGFRRLRGFLRGFIDAVFHDGERYYLADYKSNHLGARQADYLAGALVEPMIEHDYVLQYLLYAVALDRHLAACLADYDYDRHFGGVYYLFLRGFAPDHAPLCGVFHDRPPREIVEAVSELMGLDPGGRKS